MSTKLFALFLIVPIIEIALFLTVGRMIGLPATIFLILTTAVLGATLTRRQGTQALARFQEKLAHGKIAGEEVAGGLLILVAGALLLTPGFFTDTIGFTLLIPSVRKWIGVIIAKRYAGKVVGGGVAPQGSTFPGRSPQSEGPASGRVIDVEAEVESRD